jgi:hypothetical protein
MIPLEGLELGHEFLEHIELSKILQIAPREEHSVIEGTFIAKALAAQAGVFLVTSAGARVWGMMSGDSRHNKELKQRSEGEAPVAGVAMSRRVRGSRKHSGV